MFSRILILSACLSLSFVSSAQEVNVRGHFSEDSIQIGRPISYYLSARYPAKKTVLFPDSSYSFAPFEFQKKNYVPTVTKDGISYDSVIYTLTTFEIDSLQTLSLPVFVVEEQDCTRVVPITDTVIFDKTVENLPDSTQLAKIPLKTNTNYWNVSWLLNYPLLSIIGGIIIVVLVIIWLVFGRRIRNHFQRKRLEKKHLAFLENFNQWIERSETDATAQSTETALFIWKKYIEDLIGRPYTKFTTKEISKYESDQRLIESLWNIDRMIYARQSQGKGMFVNLKRYSEDQYFKKLEEIKNG
ncbi:MAG: hypothetical protein ACK5RG_05860 [Cyclobacteriaceae bacterium]|nr:hypothetical protein [Flammeovirgaceae bacterium]